MDDSNRKRQLVAYGVAGLFCLLVIVGLLMALSSRNHRTNDILVQQQQALAASPYADPILQYLPYGDIGYNISPSLKTISGKNSLVIEVAVTFSGSDYKLTPDEQAALIKQRQQAALNYIRSKGLDPGKYTVQYTTPSS